MTGHATEARSPEPEQPATNTREREADPEQNGRPERRRPTLREMASAGDPVDPDVRGAVERRVGVGLSGTRVHRGPHAAASAAAISARAYTRGDHIVLASGERIDDRRLMAHELVHVAQQRASASALQRKPDGATGPRSSAAETQADTIGDDIGSTMLVDRDPGPGQLTATAFMTELERRVTDAANDELGPLWSAAGCPYIEAFFTRHRSSSADHLDRLAKRYSRISDPTSANDYFDPILARIRAGIGTWRAGEDVSTHLRSVDLAGLTDLVPPAGERRPVLQTSDRRVQRKAAGDREDRAKAPASDMATSTSPLPAELRRRLGHALADDFSDVRVHTGARAAHLAADRGAHAVSWDRDIAFAHGDFDATSVFGQAVLAHELAHLGQSQAPSASHQQTESDADLGAVAGLAVLDHPALRGLPLRAVGSLAQRSRRHAARGLELHACSDSVPTRSWVGTGGADAETAAQAIRSLLRERDSLVSNTTRSERDDQRLAEIDRQLREQVQVLRSLGIRTPTDDLLAQIIDDTPVDELMEMGIERLEGDSPKTVRWGERRRFRAVTRYLPPAVDVRYRWLLREAPYDQPDFPLRGAQSSESTAELGLDHWHHLAEIERMTATTLLRHFKIGVQMELGSSIVTREWTDELTMEHGLPDSLSISISPTAPTTADTDPAAPPRVLKGARAKAVPSWFPRRVPNSTEPSHSMFWKHLRGGRTIRSWWGPAGHGQFDETGRHTISVGVHPLQRFDERSMPAPLLAASVDVDVVSATQLADDSLGIVASQMDSLSFGDYDRQLAAAVEEADLVRQAGSTEQEAVNDRYDALKKMQEEVRRHMYTTSEMVDPDPADYHTGVLIGGRSLPPATPRGKVRASRRQSAAPVPFPDSEGDFEPTAYYARTMPAVFVHPSVGVPQPLTLLTQVHHDGQQWRAKIVDATTQDVVRHEGGGGTPRAAYGAAISDWKSDNEYPDGGYVSFEFRPFAGWFEPTRFSTDSLKKSILQWFDRVLFVVGAIVGVLLLLAPEPTGLTKGAGYAVLAATVLRSTYGIYKSLDLGRPLLDERHILEGVGIIAAVIGLRGGLQVAAATRTAAQGEALAGRALTQFKVGRAMVYTAGALDTGTFVYVAAGALPRIKAAMKNDASGDSDAALMRILGQLAVQGLVVFGSNRDLFRGMATKGTGPQGVLRRLAGDEPTIVLDPADRGRLEAELRAGGHDDPTSLPDVALLQRVQAHHAKLTAARPDAGDRRSAPVDAPPRALRQQVVELRAEIASSKLRDRVGDPTNPKDHQADIEMLDLYKALPITELVSMVRTKSRWNSVYAERALGAGGGTRGSLAEYMAIENLDILRHNARYDPEAAHALIERYYRDLTPVQLENRAKAGDTTAKQVLENPRRGPSMDVDAENRLIESIWEQRRTASELADTEAAATAALREGTVGAAETDIPGIGQLDARGSPRAPTDIDPAIPREVTPATTTTQAQHHVEEQILNDIIRRIEAQRLAPAALEGKTVRIVVDQQVCSYCAAGLSNADAHGGVLRQFSDRYPGIKIEISDLRTGDYLQIRNERGKIRIDHHRRAGKLTKRDR